MKKSVHYSNILIGVLSVFIITFFDLKKYLFEDIIFYPMIILLLISPFFKRKKTSIESSNNILLIETNNDYSNKIGQRALSIIISIPIVYAFFYSDFSSLVLVFFFILCVYSIYDSTITKKSLSIEIKKNQLIFTILPNFKKIMNTNEISQITFTNNDICILKKDSKKSMIHFLNINDKDKSEAISLLKEKIGNDVQIN